MHFSIDVFFAGVEGGMQVVRKSSSSKYSLRFIRATDNGTRNNRSMAICSIGFAARYALRRSTATQSVNNLKITHWPTELLPRLHLS